MFKTAISSGPGVNAPANANYAVRSQTDSLKNPNAAEARNPNFQLIPETRNPRPSRNYVQIKFNSKAGGKSEFTFQETDGKQSDYEQQWQVEFAAPLATATKKRESEHDDSSERRRSAQQLYVSKLKELDEITGLGMSDEATAHAQRLAIDIILYTNAETLRGQKTFRDLREVISQMIKRLTLIGISLPTEAEKILSLIKIQSDSLPFFIESRIDGKYGNSGHLLPLMMIAIGRQDSGAVNLSGELSSNSNLASL